MNLTARAAVGALLPVCAVLTACGTSGGLDDNGSNLDPCKDVVNGYPCRPYGTDVGDTVMNFTFYDPDTGEAVHLSDYIKDEEGKRADKVFIITSFAEWCGACKLESPEIYETYTELRDRGVELLMTLNQDAERRDDPDSIAAAATRWESSVLSMSQGDDQFLGVLADRSKYLNSFYDINATPMNMIVGPSFNIYYKITGWEGKEQFTKILDAIIKQELEPGS